MVRILNLLQCARESAVAIATVSSNVTKEHLYKCVCMCVCVRVCACVCVCARVSAFNYERMCACIVYMCTHTYVYVYMFNKWCNMHVHVHVCTCTCVYMYMCTRFHTHECYDSRHAIYTIPAKRFTDKMYNVMHISTDMTCG